MASTVLEKSELNSRKPSQGAGSVTGNFPQALFNKKVGLSKMVTPAGEGNTLLRNKQMLQILKSNMKNLGTMKSSPQNLPFPGLPWATAWHLEACWNAEPQVCRTPYGSQLPQEARAH